MCDNWDVWAVSWGHVEEVGVQSTRKFTFTNIALSFHLPRYTSLSSIFFSSTCEFSISHEHLPLQPNQVIGLYKTTKVPSTSKRVSCVVWF